MYSILQEGLTSLGEQQVEQWQVMSFTDQQAVQVSVAESIADQTQAIAILQA